MLVLACIVPKSFLDKLTGIATLFLVLLTLGYVVATYNLVNKATESNEITKEAAQASKQAAKASEGMLKETMKNRKIQNRPIISAELTSTSGLWHEACIKFTNIGRGVAVNISITLENPKFTFSGEDFILALLPHQSKECKFVGKEINISANKGETTKVKLKYQTIEGEEKQQEQAITRLREPNRGLAEYSPIKLK